jgi:tRNA-dihydrouridine synthase A
MLEAQQDQPARLSVAPMMDWTDRHCRMFHRHISRHTLLYTEMITSAALVHGDAERLLRHSAQEHPVALQLGGSNPEELAKASKIGAEAGYDEINLNIGCPSDRVQSGWFGACLMKEPDLVRDCLQAMASQPKPVTAKTRIGVDDQDPRDVLPAFVEMIQSAGVQTVVIHARKAWLDGLSPKQNRDIPPLDYLLIYDIKRAFPDMTIVINGGIQTLDEAEKHLELLDGAMIGRAAYQTPSIMLEADHRIFGSDRRITAEHAVEAMLPYIENALTEGVRLNQITRHMLGLFNGRPGARLWRRTLSEEAHKPGAGPELVLSALSHLAQDAA